MKKRNSLHGFLADKNNPISMEEILKELRKDRGKGDVAGLEANQRVAKAWKRYDEGKFVKKSKNEFLKDLEEW